MPENTDPITSTLDTLRSDVERNPLADSLSVRRRGDRRTRHQVVAGAVVVVALVVGVVGLYGGSGGGSRRTAPPASPSRTAEVIETLAPEPLILTNDIPSAGSYTDFQRSPDPVDETPRPIRCLTSPTGWGADQVVSASYFQDLGAHVIEHVLRYSDIGAAQVAVQRPLDDLSSCPSGKASEVTVTNRPAEHVSHTTGDEAYRASRLSTPTAASEPLYYEVGVARRANVVVVVEWTSGGNPYGGDGSGWVFGPQGTLQAALIRATGS